MILGYFLLHYSWSVEVSNRRVYGDKAYDDRKNFNILDEINAEPAISIRKNASTISKRCPLRRDEVLLI